MFSVSPAEIFTIAIVALIVFGPSRLPEMTRKAGKVIREIRDTAQELREGIEREAGGSLDLGDVRREMRATLAELDRPAPRPTDEQATTPDTPDEPS